MDNKTKSMLDDVIGSKEFKKVQTANSVYLSARDSYIAAQFFLWGKQSRKKIK